MEDGKALRKQVFGFGVNLVALASVQLGIDIIASYCANQTAATIGYSGFTGSGVVAILLQTLSIYFAINAGAPPRPAAASARCSVGGASARQAANARCCCHRAACCACGACGFGCSARRQPCAAACAPCGAAVQAWTSSGWAA